MFLGHQSGKDGGQKLLFEPMFEGAFMVQLPKWAQVANWNVGKQTIIVIHLKQVLSCMEMSRWVISRLGGSIFQLQLLQGGDIGAEPPKAE